MEQAPGYKTIENDYNYIAVHRRALAAITISLGLLAKTITDKSGADFNSLTVQTGQAAYDNVIAMSDEEIDRIIAQILDDENHLVEVSL
ncbi:MAG: hypothetical protein WBF90_38735, partial [Rivularia sp. (in: cyanobacteria)]